MANGTFISNIEDIEEIEEGLTQNKVANFAYTDTAYTNNEVDGVEEYDFEEDQNIPLPNAEILKVNPTVLTKGWRAQASAITRMLMNHFLGRCSYNLNKVNDLMASLLSTIKSFYGQANGIATLDENGILEQEQLPPATYEYKKYMADSSSPKTWLAKLFKRDYGVYWNTYNGDKDISKIAYGKDEYGDDIYVALNDTPTSILWSNDIRGEWTTVSPLPSTSGVAWSDVFYFKGAFYVTLGTTALWKSLDGKNWANTGITLPASYLYTVGEIDDSLWLTETTSRTTYVTSDMETFTALDFEGSSGYVTNKVITLDDTNYLASVYIQGSSVPTIYYSTDKINWTATTRTGWLNSCPSNALIDIYNVNTHRGAIIISSDKYKVSVCVPSTSSVPFSVTQLQTFTSKVDGLFVSMGVLYIYGYTPETTEQTDFGLGLYRNKINASATVPFEQVDYTEASGLAEGYVTDAIALDGFAYLNISSDSLLGIEGRTIKLLMSRNNIGFGRLYTINGELYAGAKARLISGYSELVKAGIINE